LSEQLNKRILEKLDKCDCEEVVKSFLKEMLYFELQNLEFAKPAYTKHYDARIEAVTKEYIKGKEGKHNEN